MPHATLYDHILEQGNQKMKRRTPSEDMSKTPNDTDDDMERAQKGKRADGGKCQRRENMAAERWGEERKDKYIPTWPIMDGKQEVKLITS